MIKHDTIFDKVIRSVTFSILYVLLIALIVGVLNIFASIGLIIFEVLDGNFIHLNFTDVVISVLTVFVLIDFSRLSLIIVNMNE